MKEIVARIHKAFLHAFKDNMNLGMGIQSMYDEGAIALVLEHSAENVITPTEASAQLRLLDYKTPDGDTVFYHLSRQKRESIQRCFGGIIADTISKAKRQRLLNIPLDYAIDFNDIPWYGERKRFTIVDRHRNGTRHFIRFANGSVVHAGRRFIVASIPVTPKMKKWEIVEALITRARELGIRIRHVFLDRGFYAVHVLKVLDDNGLKYVIPAPENKGIRKRMKALLRKNKRITIYTSWSWRDNTCVTTNLFLFWNRGRRTWRPFVTNTEINETNRVSLGEHYRARWSIETLFRVKNGFRIRSRSGVHAVRITLYLTGIALYNMWILLNIWEAQRFGEEPEKPKISVARFLFYIEILLHSGSF